jgi:hypothetical protein
MTQHDDLTTDIKTKARELGQDAKDAVYAEAGRTTSDLSDHAADGATKAADAAEAAASDYSDDSLQARAARQVADQVEGLAAQLRSADFATVARDASDFARKNPALFIGGAALLGFAATRFLKARDPARVDYGDAEHDPWRTQEVPRAQAVPNPVAPNPTSRGFDVPS